MRVLFPRKLKFDMLTTVSVRYQVASARTLNRMPPRRDATRDSSSTSTSSNVSNNSHQYDVVRGSNSLRACLTPPHWRSRVSYTRTHNKSLLPEAEMPQLGISQPSIGRI